MLNLSGNAGRLLLASGRTQCSLHARLSFPSHAPRTDTRLSAHVARPALRRLLSSAGPASPRAQLDIEVRRHSQDIQLHLLLPLAAFRSSQPDTRTASTSIPTSTSSDTSSSNFVDLAILPLPCSPTTPLVDLAKEIQEEFGNNFKVSFVPSHNRPLPASTPLTVVAFTSGDVELCIQPVSAANTYTLNVNVAELRSFLGNLVKEIDTGTAECQSLRQQKQMLDWIAGLKVGAVNYGVLSILSGQLIGMIYLTVKMGWDLMEPYSYFLSSVNIIVATGYFIFRRNELTFEDLGIWSREYFTEWLYRMRKFDVERYQNLKRSLEDKKSVKSLLEELLPPTPKQNGQQ